MDSGKPATAGGRRRPPPKDRQNELARQFAPKSRREDVEANIAARERAHARAHAESITHCATCGGARVSRCKCFMEESVCANGHHWYRCAEHGRRVNREHDPDVPCGHR